MEELSSFQFAKSCNKCGELFECRADAIQECHCSKKTLNAEQQRLIRTRYNDCLCSSCLEVFTENVVNME